MYNILKYKEKDKKIIHEFIAKYPFAFLSGCNAENSPIATQLPLFFETQNTQSILYGHLMKDSDHYRAFIENENVLAVFSGKHTYVSGTWYTNPNTASTWNYMSVHVKGKIRFLSNQDLEIILRRTSLYFEDQDPKSTTIYDNLPLNFKDRALELIAGFEIEIHEIDTVFKLSQDRDYESYQNIINHLKVKDESARVIAQEMEKRKIKLFQNNQE